MPETIPLSDGKVYCMSCHDASVLAAKPTNGPRGRRRGAKQKPHLRGGPYEARTDFCFQCHDPKRYERKNAHLQLDDHGDVMLDRCLYCHTEKPDVDRSSFEDIALVNSSETICLGCHTLKPRHTGNIDHMVKPPKPFQARMAKMVEDSEIILPIDRDGKMTCITCHNPHQKGVIPFDRPSAKGADSRYRHRTAAICTECHGF